MVTSVFPPQGYILECDDSRVKHYGQPGLVQTWMFHYLSVNRVKNIKSENPQYEGKGTIGSLFLDRPYKR